jgi:hypothetical protein
VLGIGGRDVEVVVPLGEVGVAVDLLHAEGGEQRVVRRLGRRLVGDPDAHVVEHSHEYATNAIVRQRGRHWRGGPDRGTIPGCSPRR